MKILKEVIKQANNYGKMNLDFNVKLLKIKDDVATVQCWNDGDSPTDRYKATIACSVIWFDSPRVINGKPKVLIHLLEVKHGGNESQFVGASGHALCAILYV